MKIIADDKIPFLEGILEPYAEVVYLPGKQIVRDIVKDADALLIRTRTKCDESLLKDTGVSFIGTATIGFDHIDTQYCETHNIKWINAPGCNSSSVRQYIAAALLKIASERRIILKNKTIGIIGAGNVGSKVEKFADTIGMKVLLCDPPRARKEGEKNFANLGRIIKESDFITVHVPLNKGDMDNTYHLFNESNFSEMKRGAWFLNTSRGEVAETNALKMALGSGTPGGAVIDVWENEPDIDMELMGKAFIATPHIAGYSTDGKANGTAMVVNSLCSFFNLPIKNWYPVNVPLPSVPLITIECEEKSDEAIIGEAVFKTYNIIKDDIRFRFSPADFEKQRGDYPMRREFSSYQINLPDGTKRIRKMLGTLGFTIL